MELESLIIISADQQKRGSCWSDIQHRVFFFLSAQVRVGPTEGLA